MLVFYSCYSRRQSALGKTLLNNGSCIEAHTRSLARSRMILVSADNDENQNKDGVRKEKATTHMTTTTSTMYLESVEFFIQHHRLVFLRKQVCLFLPMNKTMANWMNAFQSFAEPRARMNRAWLIVCALSAVICCANSADFVVPFFTKFIQATTCNQNIDGILKGIMAKESPQQCSRCDMIADMTRDLTDFSQNAHRPVKNLVGLYCVKA